MKLWMEQKLSGTQVEPNGTLGSAFQYILIRLPHRRQAVCRETL